MHHTQQVDWQKLEDIPDRTLTDARQQLEVAILLVQDIISVFKGRDAITPFDPFRWSPQHHAFLSPSFGQNNLSSFRLDPARLQLVLQQNDHDILSLHLHGNGHFTGPPQSPQYQREYDPR